MNIGPLEVVIVVLVLLLIFGGRRIPELGRALGTGFHDLREHVGRKPPKDRKLDGGGEAPRPSSPERVENEETAKHP